jgi:hypothetical protein
MATALTAQGIGFSGAPREYTGIIMQRNRQKQLDEQAAREKKDKEFGDLSNKIYFKDPGQFLSFHLPVVKSAMMTAIGDATKFKEKGDLENYNKTLANLQFTLNDYSRQKKEYDDVVKSGKYVVDPKLRDLENAPDENEALKRAENLEGVTVNPTTRSLNFKGATSFPTSKFYKDLANDKRLLVPDGVEYQNGPLGKVVAVQKYKVDKDLATNILKDAINQEDVFSSEAANYRINNPNSRKLPDLEFKQAVIDNFIDRGLNELGVPKQDRKYLGQNKFEINVDARSGDQQDQGDLGGISNVRLKFNPKVKTLTGGEINYDYDVPTKGLISVKDVTGTYPTTMSLFNAKTGQLIEKPGVTKGTYNVSLYAPVLYKPINVMGVNLPAGLIVNAASLDKIKPGLAKMVYQQGDVRAGIVSFGKLEDGTDVYRTAEMSDQTQKTALGKEDTATYEKLEAERKRVSNEVNNEIEKVKGKPAPTSKAAAPKPAAVKPKRLIWDNKQKKMVEAK